MVFQDPLGVFLNFKKLEYYSSYYNDVNVPMTWWWWSYGFVVVAETIMVVLVTMLGGDNSGDGGGRGSVLVLVV